MQYQLLLLYILAFVKSLLNPNYHLKSTHLHTIMKNNDGYLTMFWLHLVFKLQFVYIFRIYNTNNMNLKF